ncbi:glycine cleavage system protein GcvH [Mariprofundus erugo]|uniref:Glycine cleavage system H protein n=1 Tax=Mariprofundus erugo TaxID=2528639 RepID=A0A5R9GWT2_9PROT|nr:glycine cleavage system protein GcvH [Mariprofundus erugo]TLS68653.1 glycine cleavage system protein GcvH [Mariprofundus erugo]TLS77654.1 glycine cleavage system protein GcvH [Mariprofundus erugo]
MTIPAGLKYTKEHEWVRIDGDTATFGITDHAQEALGDIVFVELPEVGRVLTAGEAYAVVESVKAVSDVYAPVGGEVIEVNDLLDGEPENVNSDAYGAGWIARVKITADDSVELMSDDEYNTFLEE